MRAGELDCIHGVGHSAGVHGCDGCCTPLVRKAKAEAWEEGIQQVETDGWIADDQVAWWKERNPYRQEETE